MPTWAVRSVAKSNERVGGGRYGRELLVNTTGPYKGTVLLNPESFALTVTARPVHDRSYGEMMLH
jgi:hypothetical protein